MCCIAFCGFMRIDEILSLSCKDIEFYSHNGSKVIHFFLKDAKTDVPRQGQHVHISERSKGLCPVKVLSL